MKMKDLKPGMVFISNLGHATMIVYVSSRSAPVVKIGYLYAGVNSGHATLSSFHIDADEDLFDDYILT